MNMNMKDVGPDRVGVTARCAVVDHVVAIVMVATAGSVAAVSVASRKR